DRPHGLPWGFGRGIPPRHGGPAGARRSAPARRPPRRPRLAACPGLSHGAMQRRGATGAERRPDPPRDLPSPPSPPPVPRHVLTASHLSAAAPFRVDFSV